MFFYWLTIFSLFIVDRLSKVYILQKSSLISSVVTQTGGDFLSFYLNKNLAFSLPIFTWILWPLLLGILAWLLFFTWQMYQQKQIIFLPLSLIILGAVSNILDRLLYGGVVDFINIWQFPVFNLSDVYITSGVLWVLFFELKKQK
jgi:signal peptidase II